jgi:hypothetical protein
VWRQHEQLHRLVLVDYQRRLAAYSAHRSAVERVWTEDALSMCMSKASTEGKDSPVHSQMRGQLADCTAERNAFSVRCWHQSTDLESTWLRTVSMQPLSPPSLSPIRLLYLLCWTIRTRCTRLSFLLTFSRRFVIRIAMLLLCLFLSSAERGQTAKLVPEFYCSWSTW